MAAQATMAQISHSKIMLISDVAGRPQTFFATECVAYAQEGDAVRACSAGAGLPATLVPRGALVIAFVVDRNGSTFLWHDGLYAARTEYSLEHFVGPDSIVYGFVFPDKELSMPVVRLFDASRLRGACLLGRNCFERFGKLFEEISALSRSRTSLVRMHWVWTEGWVDEFVLRKPDEALHGLDCEWERAIRLPQLLSPDACYNAIESVA
jgi:hypothetical protein